jgi:hypothetical protein
MNPVWRHFLILSVSVCACAVAGIARADTRQVNFDDITGTGIRPVALDRYSPLGLQLETTGAGLFAFGPSNFATSAPNWLYASQAAAGSNADAPITLRFRSPKNGAAAVTDDVSFSIADGDAVGPWTVHGYDINNTQIALVTAATQIRLTGKPIHRVVFTPSADFDGIDSLLFNEVVEPDELEFTTPVRFGGQWRYLHPTTNIDPATSDADFHSTWFKNNGTYNGPAFSTPRTAPLGYGTLDLKPLVTDIGTPASGARYTAYFTTTFEVADATLVRTLAIDLLADDGAFVYLNGNLVTRHNVSATAADTYRLLATDVEVNGVSTEQGTFTYLLDPAALVSGTNFLAVSVHNQSSGSSDIAFDLQMSASLFIVPEPAGEWLALAALSTILTVVCVRRRFLAMPTGGGNSAGFVSNRNETAEPPSHGRFAWKLHP